MSSLQNSQYGSQNYRRFSRFASIFCFVFTVGTSTTLICNHFHTSWHLNAHRKTMQRRFRNHREKNMANLLRFVKNIRDRDCFARNLDTIHKFNHFNFNLNERDYKDNSLKVTFTVILSSKIEFLKLFSFCDFLQCELRFWAIFGSVSLSLSNGVRFLPPLSLREMSLFIFRITQKILTIKKSQKLRLHLLYVLMVLTKCNSTFLCFL